MEKSDLESILKPSTLLFVLRVEKFTLRVVQVNFIHLIYSVLVDILLHAVWSAVGIIMSSVCPSVTLCIVAKRYRTSVCTSEY